jgi:regulator of protease activity HflC (stomatin/prohibitin superfamily)
MNDLAIFAITLIGVGALLIAKTITIVSQSDVYVIERLGKFSRELSERCYCFLEANHIINGFFCALHLAKNQTINSDINIVFGNN